LETVWKLKKTPLSEAQELAAELMIPLPIASVMIQRGIDTVEKAEEFFDLSPEKLHDPWLLPDIEPVVDRLEKAIKDQEYIYVHGDYDVDGVTSTSVITHSLRLFGAHFEYHVPHRIQDGYDVRVATVDKAIAAGAKILMTVDCGIVAFEAASYAKANGVDLIITDHHHPSDDDRIPEAVGVVNPNRHDSKYPFNGLAGVGIAFKTMLALGDRMQFDRQKLMDELLDYVALGTVADVAPMVDENRILVHLGCQQLTKAEKPGVAELLKVAGVKTVNTTSIGFFLGPRINAIGRMGDSAIALDLLLERVPSRAAYFADVLNKANDTRQKKEKQTVEEAIALVGDVSDSYVIVVGARGWHPGLIGLVAGKLAEQFARPTLACTINEEGKAKGSCRSVRDFNILDALKSEKVWPLFSRRSDGSVVCGGHAFAAGFEVPEKNLDSLRTELNAYAKKVLDGEIEDKKVYDIDAGLLVSQLDEQVFKHMIKMAPFGSGNPEPMFLVRNAVVESCSTVGADGKHLKMRLKSDKKHSNNFVSAIAWRKGHLAPKVGDKIDLIGKLSFEEFRGRTELTFTVEDFKPSSLENISR
jgi:single-stranded-DNA-specific exonuclease